MIFIPSFHLVQACVIIRILVSAMLGFKYRRKLNPKD